ncbi:MAG: DUF3841 domain-containing protein [Negativibacillus sp.]
MKQITVWTKQHRSVLEQLEKTGRYIARREYIEIENQECAPLVLEVYDWLVQHSPNAKQKPADVDYPVWVSFAQDTTYLPQEQTVTLKLDLDPALIAPVHIAKWGTILNYSYIPLNEQDARRHRQLLESYRVSDTQAYMSHFYPQIKREIIDSWGRLFDDSVHLNSDQKYGIIWEIKKEWVSAVLR